MLETKLKPDDAVAISLIAGVKKLPACPIVAGLNLLFLLSVGESIGTLKNVGFKAKSVPTTSLSGVVVNFDSPKSCIANTFLKLLSVFVTLFCLLVIQTSILVIFARESITG